MRSMRQKLRSSIFARGLGSALSTALAKIAINADPEVFWPFGQPFKNNKTVTRTRIWLIVATVIGASVQTKLAHGQEQHWNNFTNIDAWFENPLNWSPGGVPGPGSELYFSGGNALWNGNTQAIVPLVRSVTVGGPGSAANVSFVNTVTSLPYQLSIDGDLTVQSGTLNVSGLNLRYQDVDIIDNGVLNIDGSHPVGAALTRFYPWSSSFINVSGAMNVTGPSAFVNSNLAAIGSESSGVATVSGAGAVWNTDSLDVGSYAYQFLSASGTLNVLNGGVFNSIESRIGTFEFSNGIVNVSGAGSRFESTSFLVVGLANDGTLNITEGGHASANEGHIGLYAGVNGEVKVDGPGSSFAITDLLQVGDDGTATLDIQDGGSVTVAPNGTTSIGAGGLVRISGANSRFEFGQTTISDLHRIEGSGGSLAGILRNTGYTDIDQFTDSISQDVNLDDVRLVNSGRLFGDASIRFALENSVSGEVETSAGDRMRFAGNANTNAGEINNFGGQIRFDHYVDNESSGIITGRGQFIADEGWNNGGVMAFSAGITDVLGDVYNQEGSIVITTGNATTTFHDDVYNEGGSEIRTSINSSTVFLGDLGGSGNFTGQGTVYIEGDLRPGNSPGTMSFGGDLSMSDSASVLIELGGLDLGEFDQLFVEGDLFLGDSLLNVAIWNEFVLSRGMQFLIANVEGDLHGQFRGLGEGSLVGNFGGSELFITYNGFGGNRGIGLFTSAVPEPSALALCALTSVLYLIRHRRPCRNKD